MPPTKTSAHKLFNFDFSLHFSMMLAGGWVVGCAIETDDVPDSILASQTSQEPNIMDCTYPSYLLCAAVHYSAFQQNMLQ